MNKTTVLPKEKITRSWHLVDVSGKTLGRVCTEIATLLIGKHKPNFSYHNDEGDYVVVTNATQVQVTGRKLKEKFYHTYSNFPGGLKSLTLGELLKKDARKVIANGVYGMLPKNKLRDRRMTRLRIFLDATHNHEAQLKKGK